MKRLFTGPAFALALSASTFMAGCTEPATDEPAANTTVPATEERGTGDATEEAADAAGADAGDTAGAETAAADDTTTPADAATTTPVVAKLTPEEQAAASAQHMCPVSDEELGSMGDPIKVTVKGRDVYVCCDACIEEVQNNPDKYLAILDKAAEEKAAGEAAPADATEADGAAG
jgi:hypothetical protein